MAHVAPLLVTLAALLAVVPSGTAIGCYKCSDLTDGKSLRVETTGDGSLGDKIAGGLNKAFQGINDAIGQVTGPPCSEFTKSDDRFRSENCLVSCGKVVLANGKTIRSCLPTPQEDGCRETDQGVTCTCSTDYCNGAGRGVPDLPLMLLLPAALLALLNSRP